MEFGKLGTKPDGKGNWKYDPQENPLLDQGIKGVAADGREQAMHPRNYATAEAAKVIAEVLGGEVVRDPGGPAKQPNRPCLGIAVGEVIVNAAAICMTLGNDAGFANAYRKSQDICELAGIPFDSGMADRLFSALVAAGLVK